MSAYWTRLSSLSILIIISLYTIFVIPYNPFSNEGRDLLFDVLITLVISRVIQLLLIDQYVAHIESTRWTRGWDGLMTSLFVTTDNKKDIVERRFASVEDVNGSHDTATNKHNSNGSDTSNISENNGNEAYWWGSTDDGL